MKKRVLSAVLSLILVLPLCAATLGMEKTIVDAAPEDLLVDVSAPDLETEGTGFVDVAPEDWFAPYVEVCAEDGLLNGVGNGKFNPDGLLNGDEALVMAARVLLHANGETVFPKGPDAQGFWDWAGQEGGYRFYLGLSVEETQQYVDAWHWDALFYLAQQAGPEPFSEGVVYPASRWAFFRALAIASQGMELPAINDISAVPGTRDERILTLYRAGILSGTDEYGTFSGGRKLTRAEAAAALARLARPELRVKFDPLPFPYSGYTLTPLLEVNGGFMGLGYPVAAVDYYDEAGHGQTGLLTLDGRLVDFPTGGHIYSSGVEQSWDYASFRVVDDQWNTKAWLMDAQGNYTPGSGKYEYLCATGDGYFLACNHRSDEELSYSQWYLLSPDGAVKWEFPEITAYSENTWQRFNEGVCPWLDEETKLWGYMDARGEWVIDPVWTGAEPFQNGYCVVYDDRGKRLVLDRDWNPVSFLPHTVADYFTFILPCSSPGYEADGLIYWQDGSMNQGLISWDRRVYRLHGIISPIRYYNGYASVWESDEGGRYYLDSSFRRRSEAFDWCGDINPDGQGFVGLEGKVYRIQFE